MYRSIAPSFVLTVAFLGTVTTPAQTQRAPAPPLQLYVGWGVDTAGAANGAIFHLWRSYLADRPDSLRPNSYWSNAEQEQWPEVDLVAPWLYQTPNWAQRFRVTVVELRPTDDTGDEYVLRALFAFVDTTSGAVRPLGLARVYAIREGGDWKLANALPRLTRAWQRRRVGAITFFFPPTHSFSEGKAAQSARYVDSLARVFEVPVPRDIRYYITRSPEELARIVGLDFAIPAVGRAYPRNRIVLSGLPEYDEWYPHELAHLVLAPMAGESFWLLSEGIATWVGGSRGRDFPTLLHELATELRHRPTFTLDSILAPHTWRDSVSYTSAAVLLKMVHEHGGIPAVRALLDRPTRQPQDLCQSVAQILGIPRSRLAGEWRRAVFRYADAQ